MKRYIYASVNLIPIEYDKNWMYKPRDNSELYANPIEYAGDVLTKEVVKHFYGFDYDVVSEEIEEVDLSELKSIQAFVTKQGLENSNTEGKKDVWAVRYDDQLYLMDGNHRVARELIKGRQTYPMKVFTIEEA